MKFTIILILIFGCGLSCISDDKESFISQVFNLPKSSKIKSFNHNLKKNAYSYKWVFIAEIKEENFKSIFKNWVDEKNTEKELIVVDAMNFHLKDLQYTYIFKFDHIEHDIFSLEINLSKKLNDNNIKSTLGSKEKKESVEIDALGLLNIGYFENHLLLSYFKFPNENLVILSYEKLFDESLRYKWVFRIDQNIEKKLSDKKYLLETKKWRFLDSEVLKKYECIDEKHFADITFNLKDPKNTAYVTIFERLKDIILEDESVRIINNQDGAELSEQENINKKLKNELFKKDNLIINKEEELEKLMKKVEELEKRK